MIRVQQNFKLPREERVRGKPNPQEMRTALKRIVTMMQKRNFLEDVKYFKKPRERGI